MVILFRDLETWTPTLQLGYLILGKLPQNDYGLLAIIFKPLQSQFVLGSLPQNDEYPLKKDNQPYSLAI